MNGTVRRAVRGDEPRVRAVRFEALADAPDDFDTTLTHERTLTDADWRRWIDTGATFLFESAGVPVGIVRGIPHWSDPTAVGLVAMWVHPAHRGTGAGDALVAKVIEWARSQGASAVRLDVLECNGRSRRFYARNGFRPTGSSFVSERTGLVDLEMRLDLRDDDREP